MLLAFFVMNSRNTFRPPSAFVFAALESFNPNTRIDALKSSPLCPVIRDASIFPWPPWIARTILSPRLSVPLPPLPPLLSLGPPRPRPLSPPNESSAPPIVWSPSVSIVGVLTGCFFRMPPRFVERFPPALSPRALRAVRTRSAGAIFCSCDIICFPGLRIFCECVARCDSEVVVCALRRL